MFKKLKALTLVQGYWYSWNPKVFWSHNFNENHLYTKLSEALVDRQPVWYSNFSKVLKCDRFHFLQEFLHFNGKANYRYDRNDARRGCCHKICLFTDMKLCRKLQYPKKQLSAGKSIVLFKCQFHFKQYMKTKSMFWNKTLSAYIIKW